MISFDPLDPDYEARIRAAFDAQQAMALIGATLTVVRPGHVEIELPVRDALTQQNGFVHAGVTSAIADGAGGLAALSLLPASAAVLTAEFAVNLLSPARGGTLRAVARVLKPGRTLIVCDVEVLAFDNIRSTVCAKMMQTCIRLDDRPGLLGR